MNKGIGENKRVQGTFVDRLEKCLREKESILCVGLDPALPDQRNKHVIPKRYLDVKDDSETRLNFCLDVFEKVADLCVAAKANEQYLRGFTSEQHQILVNTIRRHGLISIYDCKLGDIRDTGESALFHYHRWGYDGITFNPLPGNMKEIVRVAHNHDPQIGIIALTLMSNPEAERFMKNANIQGEPLYKKIAEDVRKHSADGCVVGATGYVTEEDIITVRNLIGNERLILIPGIGVQKGEPRKAIKAGGERILINVGREIIYSENPRKMAEEYCREFNKIRESLKMA